MQYTFFFVCYLLLWGIFTLLMVATGRPWPARVDGLDLLLLCLATFRLTEIITEEKVARCLRAPFCELKQIPGPDGKMTEEEVPAGKGLRKVAGELLLCPWCAGVWIATLVTFFWLLLPGIGRVVLLAFSAAAGGLLFQIFVKLMDRVRTNIPKEPESASAAIGTPAEGELAPARTRVAA